MLNFSEETEDENENVNSLANVTKPEYSIQTEQGGLDTVDVTTSGRFDEMSLNAITPSKGRFRISIAY